MIGKVAAGAAVLVGLMLSPVIIGAAAGGPSSGGVSGIVGTEAEKDTPPEYLALYKAAAPAVCPGLPYTVLEGIGSIESNHGRNKAAFTPNYAGALGPMQFLRSTFAAYAVDGDNDGKTDILDPADAIYSAAKYLCANGGGNPAGLYKAIFAYNHADWYVKDVLKRADEYGGLGVAAPAATSAPMPVEAQNAGYLAAQRALSVLGTPYVWGGGDEDGATGGGFDCSGLVIYAYSALGIRFPHKASIQQDLVPAVPAGEPLQVGDLVFFGNPASHVGIYVGMNDKGQAIMVDAPNRRSVVRVEAINSWGNYSGAGRVVGTP